MIDLVYFGVSNSEEIKASITLDALDENFSEATVLEIITENETSRKMFQFNSKEVHTKESMLLKAVEENLNIQWFNNAINRKGFHIENDEFLLLTFREAGEPAGLLLYVKTELIVNGKFVWEGYNVQDLSPEADPILGYLFWTGEKYTFSPFTNAIPSNDLFNGPSDSVKGQYVDFDGFQAEVVPYTKNTNYPDIIYLIIGDLLELTKAGEHEGKPYWSDGNETFFVAWNGTQWIFADGIGSSSDPLSKPGFGPTTEDTPEGLYRVFETGTEDLLFLVGCISYLPE